MRQNIVETAIGVVVLIIALMFFTYAYKVSGKAEDTKGYILNATFESVEGVVTGSDIMIAGIKVGIVESLNLDKESYLAQVKLKFQDDVHIPKDSVAAIVTQGLFGGKYVMIMPGAEEINLKHNEAFKHTQSSINFESLIGKFLFSKSSSDKKNEENN